MQLAFIRPLRADYLQVATTFGQADSIRQRLLAEELAELVPIRNWLAGFLAQEEFLTLYQGMIQNGHIDSIAPSWHAVPEVSQVIEPWQWQQAPTANRRRKAAHQFLRAQCPLPATWLEQLANDPIPNPWFAEAHLFMAINGDEITIPSRANPVWSLLNNSDLDALVERRYYPEANFWLQQQTNLKLILSAAGAQRADPDLVVWCSEQTDSATARRLLSPLAAEAADWQPLQGGQWSLDLVATRQTGDGTRRRPASGDS